MIRHEIMMPSVPAPLRILKRCGKRTEDLLFNPQYGSWMELTIHGYCLLYYLSGEAQCPKVFMKFECDAQKQLVYPLFLPVARN